MSDSEKSLTDVIVDLREQNQLLEKELALLGQALREIKSEVQCLMAAEKALPKKKQSTRVAKVLETLRYVMLGGEIIEEDNVSLEDAIASKTS